MLASHYAPRTPLIMVNQIPHFAPWPRTGLLVPDESQLPKSFNLSRADDPNTLSSATCQRDSATSFAVIEVLSPAGDLIAAAARFFQALHRFDAIGLDGIVALRFPNEGLGRALNDRLKRASQSETAFP